jgi:hypothetical protein
MDELGGFDFQEEASKSILLVLNKVSRSEELMISIKEAKEIIINYVKE